MQRQTYKTAALLVIILFSLTACQKDEPLGITPEVPPDFSDDLDPAWSPDGRHIIYRKRGDFVYGEGYDDDDPKLHGSL